MLSMQLSLESECGHSRRDCLLGKQWSFDFSIFCFPSFFLPSLSSRSLTKLLVDAKSPCSRLRILLTIPDRPSFSTFLPLPQHNHGALAPSRARVRHQHSPFIPDHLFPTIHPFRIISSACCGRRRRICNGERHPLYSRRGIHPSKLDIGFLVLELDNSLERHITSMEDYRHR